MKNFCKLVSFLCSWSFTLTSTTLANQYADDPESWLIVYNSNDPQSVSWASFYAAEHDIPASNLLGIPAPAAEHINTHAEAESLVFGPIRAFLDDPRNLPITQNIMGILLGYRMPGSYERSEYQPTGSQYGGYAITSALLNLYNDKDEQGNLIPPATQNDLPSSFNPDYINLNSNWLGSGLRSSRLSKNQMTPNYYMSARIDAPTLAIAQQLTTRAKEISKCTRYFSSTDKSFWDYLGTTPTGSTFKLWFFWLTANNGLTPINMPNGYGNQNHTNAIPSHWEAFNVETNPATHHAAFRIDAYKLLGWSASNVWSTGTNQGEQILGYSLNSFGMVTARETVSTSATKSPTGKDFFVPNAISNGWAAAIGSTGEPTLALHPIPKVIFESLRAGWTLGEAFHLTQATSDRFWSIVGDPRMRIPHWFDVTEDQCVEKPSLEEISEDASTLTFKFEENGDTYMPCDSGNWQDAISIESNPGISISNVQQIDDHTLSFDWNAPEVAICNSWVLKVEVCDQSGNRAAYKKRYIHDISRKTVDFWTPECLDYIQNGGLLVESTLPLAPQRRSMRNTEEYFFSLP